MTSHRLITAGLSWAPPHWWPLIRKGRYYAARNMPYYDLEPTRHTLWTLRRVHSHELLPHFKYVNRPGEKWGEDIRVTTKDLLGTERTYYEGSCNDWSPIYWRLVMKKGIKNGCFRLVRCKVSGYQIGHMVCAVETMKGTFISDCRYVDLLPIDHEAFKDYTWIDCSQPNSFFWRRIDNERMKS